MLASESILCTEPLFYIHYEVIYDAFLALALILSFTTGAQWLCGRVLDSRLKGCRLRLTGGTGLCP